MALGGFKPQKKPYLKPLLSFEDQARLLIARGMGGDVREIAGKLVVANYYRLSGYFYFFRKHQGQNRHLGEEYRDGLRFDDIWKLYTFDSRLRGIVLEAIERIEIAIRTQVSFRHAERFGPFAYAIDPPLRISGSRSASMRRRIMGLAQESGLELRVTSGWAPHWNV
jgi:abortive infection bacteriophage resistance protein